MEYDLLLKNGKVIDGTGNPWFWADIAIKDGKIKRVGKIETEAQVEIDVSGQVVSPGWIDIHTHADHTVLGNTRCESYIHQGVTTVTMGNCGLSMYPLLDDYKDELISYLKPFTSGLELNWGWKTLKDFLALIEEKGVGINLTPFVGHGSIRINVMGFQAEDPSSDELFTMGELLREALEEGAFGLSTGLGYPPGIYTRDEEIIELCKILHEYEGLYTTHMRVRAENLSETIELGFKAKVPIQVSHLGSSCASHQALSGKHNETTLKKLDEARSKGLDITADIYPYTAGSSLLSQFIPDWAHEGGVKKMLERLKEPKNRKRIENEYREEGINTMGRDLTKVLVTFVKSENNKKYEGMTINEIAKERGKSNIDTLCDILIEENAEAMNVTFWGVEEDVTTLVKHPAVMPCSDGWSHAPYGKLGQGRPHPRCYGTFPRYIRKYVREEQILGLEEAIRRMTSMPGTRLGLKDRGLIKEGLWADITVFDPEKIKENNSFNNPHQYPDGIPYVIVNGELTIENGKHTGNLAGKILRKK